MKEKRGQKGLAAGVVFRSGSRRKEVMKN